MHVRHWPFEVKLHDHVGIVPFMLDPVERGHVEPLVHDIVNLLRVIPTVGRLPSIDSIDEQRKHHEGHQHESQPGVLNHPHPGWFIERQKNQGERQNVADGFVHPDTGG